MESEGKSIIELEIEKVLIELNSNQILSEEERLELNDHFLCEIEDLTKLGLREEEALLVAKKRFGVLEEVNEEYQKAKPRFDWMRYGIIGVVCFSLIKIVTILVNTVAESFMMICYYFYPEFVSKHDYIDMAFRVIFVTLLLLCSLRVLAKLNFKNLESIWRIPIFYLFLELGRRLFLFIFPISIFEGGDETVLQFFANSPNFNFQVVLFLIIIAGFKISGVKLKYV